MFLTTMAALTELAIPVMVQVGLVSIGIAGFVKQLRRTPFAEVVDEQTVAVGYIIRPAELENPKYESYRKILKVHEEGLPEPIRVHLN